MRGSEFRFMMKLPAQGDSSGYSFANSLWESFAFDLVSGNIPHSEDITGVRVVDRSRQEIWIRFELWFSFKDADTDPRGKAIKDYIFNEYINKNNLTTSDIFTFENHRSYQ